MNAGGGNGRSARDAPPRLPAHPAAAAISTTTCRCAGALEAIHALPFYESHAVLDLLAALVEGWGDARVRGLFTTRPVRELLWGYTDPLLSRLAAVLPGVRPTFELVHNASGPGDTGGLSAVNTGECVSAGGRPLPSPRCCAARRPPPRPPLSRARPPAVHALSL